MGTLTVIVDKLRNTDGHVLGVVWSGPEGFPGDTELACCSERADIDGDIATLVFDLEPGRYAVTVLHDENDNAELDTNFLGVPREGFGVSGDLHFRKPSWDEHAFEHDGDTEIRIPAHYFL